MNWKRMTLAALLSLVILGGLVYLFGQWAVQQYAEPRIRQALPAPITVGNVDFQMLPLGIRLEDPRISMKASPGNAVELQAHHVSVNPTWTSVFGDTVTIDRLDFDRLTVDFYLDQPTAAPSEDAGSLLAGLSGGQDPNAPPAQFLIKEVRISDGRVRLFESRGDSKPAWSLSTIRLSAGPISPQRFKRGVPIHLTAGTRGSPRSLMFQGQGVTAPEPVLTGTLHAESAPIDMFARLLPATVQLDGGTWDATVPLLAGTDGVTLEGIDMVVRKSTLSFSSPSTPSADTSASPDSSDSSSDTEGQPAEAPAFFSLGPSRLQVEQSHIRLAEEGDAQTLDIQKGVLGVGALYPARKGIPLEGQFAFARPEGLLELTGQLDRTAAEFRVEDLLAQARVDQVKTLNPYTKHWAPITLKGGSLDGALRGSFAPSQMNLAVELAFKKLKAGPGGTPDSKLMGIPVSLLLKQLSEQDGSLDLGFQITGSTASPQVNISRIRQRLLIKLGVDAAVIGTLGLPVYAGNLAVEKITGYSVLGEARKVLGNLTAPNPSEVLPPTRTEARGTPVPSTDKRSGGRSRSSSPSK